MNDKQKKIAAISAVVIAGGFLVWLLTRRKSAAQIVHENTTPVPMDGLLAPGSYNIPPLAIQAGEGSTYGGLTFISNPASSFRCGGNPYYATPGGVIESQDGETALDVVDVVYSGLVGIAGA